MNPNAQDVNVRVFGTVLYCYYVPCVVCCGDGRGEPLYLCMNDPLLSLTAPDFLTPPLHPHQLVADPGFVDWTKSECPIHNGAIFKPMMPT